MAVRVHDFVGTNPNPVKTVASAADDDGAPPPMPGSGRVTTLSADGAVIAESTSPQSEADLEARRAAAAEKLARAPTARHVRMPSGAYTVETEDPRTLRARCLEIASRGTGSNADEVIADARRLLDFVEKG
jgi:hypothetical protein